LGMPAHVVEALRQPRGAPVGQVGACSLARRDRASAPVFEGSAWSGPILPAASPDRFVEGVMPSNLRVAFHRSGFPSPCPISRPIWDRRRIEASWRSRTWPGT
jgi:hypothetical protein